MSLEGSLLRYGGLFLSTRYAGTETDFKIQRQNGSDVSFTMPFSRDDNDRNQRDGRDTFELRDQVVGFTPAKYTVDDVEFDLVPDSSLFISVGGKWYRWHSTLEADGAGFMMMFQKAELNTATLNQNRR